ncbi:hypothetical protein [uncultured Roseovarius sp.]|uniref:hypothetical protein n=1 Tax=uncultured Roseovarius sp. TaxID=293344 RepID=UPI0025ED2804|nr:hypothetical protein [uncultured Roseovarius sp.]
MQVVIHAGAHMTDEDRLVKCLASNRELLAERGTHVPSPTRYRKLLRDMLHAAADTGLSSEAREVAHDAIVEDETADRIILSNHGFFGTPRMAASGGVLYSAADARMAAFHQIFAGDQIELFLAIRNPAAFLPAMFKSAPQGTMDDYLNGAAPTTVRWSELIGRLRHAFPELPITVWCNEDTPLIWGQIIREIAWLDPNTEFKGEFSLLYEIMSKPGVSRFRSYMNAHPGMTEAQKRRVIVAFLDKFAEETAIEEELDVSGWTEDLIDRLTEGYDEDLYEIERIPGINMISP